MQTAGVQVFDLKFGARAVAVLGLVVSTSCGIFAFQNMAGHAFCLATLYVSFLQKWTA
jgi:hypothetical protein